MLNIIKFILIGVIFLTLPNQLLAHDTVYSLKKFVGDKVVVINYNVTQPRAGVPIQFNIRLYEITSGIPVEYQKLNLEFKRGKNLVYSQEFEPKNTNEVGDATFTFPQAGDYQMDVKFLKGQEVLVEATFPLPVERKVNTSNFSLISPESSIGFILGLGMGTIVFRRNRQVLGKYLQKINFRKLKPKR